MKTTILVSISIIAMLITLVLIILVPEKILKFKNHSSDSVLLLLPDLSADDKLVQLWRALTAKEGVHLAVLTDNEFLLPINQKHSDFKGIIIPDTLHNRMSRPLAENIKSYVSSGGNLMLIYDAGTADLLGRPYKKGSLFSGMLHFYYGSVAKSGDGGIKMAPVGQSKMALNQLGIPPEKCTVDEDSTITIPNDPFCAISSYGYEPLTYQHFITKPIKKDIPLLLTTLDHQFIAGIRPLGKGKILFVNLPLTYLSLSTDDMLMQVFFRYFANHILGMPSSPASSNV